MHAGLQGLSPQPADSPPTQSRGDAGPAQSPGASEPGREPAGGATWPAVRPRRVWVEAGLALILLWLALALLDRLLLLAVGPPSVLLGGLLAAVLAMLGCTLLLVRRDAGLRYRLEPHGLVVTWGWGREWIPWSRLSVAVPREETRGEPKFRWPVPLLSGWRDGHWPRGGPARDYATSRRGQVVLLTSRRIYLLSPRDRDAFLAAVTERLRHPAETQETAVVSGLWSRPLWGDRPGLTLLALALAANLGILAAVAWQYGRIPPVVALAYDSVGQVRWVAPRSQVFLLPLGGLAFLAANTWLAWRWLDGRRLPAYLLLIGLLLTEGLLALTVLRLLS